jgi:two-component system OmpR family response regulator
MSVSSHSGFRDAIDCSAGLGQGQARATILIVADDADLASNMRASLDASGLDVILARSSEEGFQTVRAGRVSVLVIDRMTNGTEGLAVVERLRADDDWTPILAIGFEPTVDERIQYLAAGADDYLVKPFDLRELTARVGALLRRRAEDRALVVRLGAIEIDRVDREVRCMGRTVNLLPREFALLDYFARHPGEVLSRETLLHRVWGPKRLGTTNVVDVQTGNLRRKLDPTGARRYIASVRGEGFRFDPEGAPPTLAPAFHLASE